VQAFFTTAFEKQYLERYDVDKAKFRTFLRVCLDSLRPEPAQRPTARPGAAGGATHLRSTFQAPSRS
jgi:hypothetical protein